MQISNQQIQEWAESPVTEALLKHCHEELKAIESTPVADCLISGDPQRTQDNVVDLDTRRYVWDTFRELLEGDWSYFMEEEGADSEEESY